MNVFLVIFSVSIFVALLWVRAAFVSLNKDLRTLLTRQTEILRALEDDDESP